MGLGNPGLRFRFNRHNLGFLVVERLAKKKKIRLAQRAFDCLFGQGVLANQRVLLAEPLTFVNLSGQAASSIVKRRKIRLKDLLIICDDVNLPLGRIRIRAAGSDGGHKGLRSIIEALGTKSFPRLRIGVGAPQTEAEKDKPRSLAQQASGSKLSRYVLGNFNKKEIKIINETIEEAASCCVVWVKEGIAAAMSRFNEGGKACQRMRRCLYSGPD